MSDRADAYRRTAAGLDRHLTDCPLCSIGRPCPTGDDTAEDEYRAFRAWEQADPTAARTVQRRAS